MALSVPSVGGSAAVIAQFDTESDVLYLSLGEAVASYSEERPNGVILRWAYDGGWPSGVTVIGFRGHQWRVKAKELSDLAAAHLGVNWEEVKAEIRRVT
jgi:hypothetical protein